jgi:Na+/phosphate symporter
MLAFLQVQHDFRAALGLLDRFDRELAVRLRSPVHAFARRLAGAAREHFDFIRNDERRIETDAKLTDQLRVLLLIATELRQKFRRPRLRDRP